MDAVHDVMKALVDFFGTPTDMHGILAHLQS